MADVPASTSPYQGSEGLDPTNVDAEATWLSNIGLQAVGGQPLDPEVQQILTDELDAHNRNTTGFDGFNFSEVSSTKDFFSLVTMAENFAAVTGYRYFPSAANILQMANNPPAEGWTSTSVANALYQKLPAAEQQKYPNAQVGLTRDNWLATTGQYIDKMNQLTGTTSLPIGQMNQWILDGTTPQQAYTQLQQNKWVQKTFGWTRHNMDYNAFKQYQQDYREAIQGRYGDQAVNDPNAYINNLDNPLYKFQSVNAQTPAANTSTTYSQPRAGMDLNASMAR